MAAVAMPNQPAAASAKPKRPAAAPAPPRGREGLRWTEEDTAMLIDMRTRKPNLAYSLVGPILERSDLACRLHFHHASNKAREAEALAKAKANENNANRSDSSPISPSTVAFPRVRPRSSRASHPAMPVQPLRFRSIAPAEQPRLPSIAGNGDLLPFPRPYHPSSDHTLPPLQISWDGVVAPESSYAAQQRAFSDAQQREYSAAQLREYHAAQEREFYAAQQREYDAAQQRDYHAAYYHANHAHYVHQPYPPQPETPSMIPRFVNSGSQDQSSSMFQFSGRRDTALDEPETAVPRQSFSYDATPRQTFYYDTATAYNAPEPVYPRQITVVGDGPIYGAPQSTSSTRPINGDNSGASQPTGSKRPLYEDNDADASPEPEHKRRRVVNDDNSANAKTELVEGSRRHTHTDSSANAYPGHAYCERSLTLPAIAPVPTLPAIAPTLPAIAPAEHSSRVRYLHYGSPQPDTRPAEEGLEQELLPEHASTDDFSSGGASTARVTINRILNP